MSDVQGVSWLGGNLTELYYSRGDLTAGPGGLWNTRTFPGCFLRILHDEGQKRRGLESIRASLVHHLDRIGKEAARIMKFVREGASHTPLSQDQHGGILLSAKVIACWQRHVGSLFQGDDPVGKLTTIFTLLPDAPDPGASAQEASTTIERTRKADSFFRVHCTLNYETDPDDVLYITLTACAHGDSFSERSMQNFVGRLSHLQHVISLNDLWTYFHLLFDNGVRSEPEILTCITNLAQIIKRYGVDIYSLRDHKHSEWVNQLHRGEVTRTCIGDEELEISGNVDFAGDENARLVFSLTSHPQAMLVVSPHNCFATARMAMECLQPSCVTMQRILQRSERGLLVERLDTRVNEQAWERLGLAHPRCESFCSWIRSMVRENFIPSSLNPRKFMYSFDGAIRALEPMERAPFDIVALNTFLWTCSEQHSEAYTTFLTSLCAHPDASLFHAHFRTSLHDCRVIPPTEALMRHPARDAYMEQLRTLQADTVRIRDNIYAHFGEQVSRERITATMQAVYEELHLICQLPSSFRETVKQRLTPQSLHDDP